MTAHLPELPLPSLSELADEGSDPETQTTDRPSRVSFYVQYIRQCRILGEVLSSIYQSSPHGMDSVLQLDGKLLRYANSLGPIMSWTSPCDISDLEPERRLVIAMQRTVLHER